MLTLCITGILWISCHHIHRLITHVVNKPPPLANRFTGKVPMSQCPASILDDERDGVRSCIFVFGTVGEAAFMNVTGPECETQQLRQQLLEGEEKSNRSANGTGDKSWFDDVVDEAIKDHRVFGIVFIWQE